MHCIQMTAVGDPDVLQPAQVPTPEPGPGQVRVRLAAAGINPVDAKVRANGLFNPDAQPPAILGCDGAGTIDAVGPGVEQLAPGQRVLFMNGGIGLEPGNYAEYTVLDARFVTPTPDAVDDVHAAAMPLVALTAWEALFDRVALQKGERVLIHAGAGGVGHVAIQLARQAGARVITTVSDPAKAEIVRELGAEAVIHYRDDDFVDAVEHWTAGEGVDVVLDTVGGEVCTRSLHALATYGRLVTILALPEDLDLHHARVHNLTLVQELMLSPMVLGRDDLRIHQTGILAECAQRMAAGSLQVRVQETFPMAEAAAAHRRLEAGGLTGKLVLTLP
ncbi:zinc-binding dehydrogenase [Halorhodospira halophila]|uniref:zinc-binding dehydrogenase n=2 Tax=Halorhodospira halophila TaxID=1053 RepID=UPI00191496FF|nr:zinc-binding dehydrogenase [Halorhodospira halophila]MBK5942961.1 alcohol dehydrogenase [Halorhodospira halophila]